MENKKQLNTPKVVALVFGVVTVYLFAETIPQITVAAFFGFITGWCLAVFLLYLLSRFLLKKVAKKENVTKIFTLNIALAIYLLVYLLVFLIRFWLYM